MTRRLGLAAALTLFGVVGCTPGLFGPSALPPEPTYRIGGKDIKRSEWLRHLSGNLVLVNSYRDRGVSSAELLDEVVDMFLANGLDFSKLASYQPTFANGVYQLNHNGTGLGFSLYFAKDFAGFKAGDLVPHNLFDHQSFIRNVNVSVDLSGIHYTYDRGPLFDLIDGDVSLSGQSLSGIKVAFKLDSSYLAFKVSSQNVYHGQPPRTEDTLTLKMATGQTGFGSFDEQVKNGGFKLVFDGTAYDSPTFKLQQTFTKSEQVLKEDAQGGYWEGTYQAHVVRETLDYHLKGFVSNRAANYTAFYGDEALTQPIGTASHDLELKGGTFTFADGATIRYGLEDF